MDLEKKDLEDENSVQTNSNEGSVSLEEYRSKLDALQAELKGRDQEITRLQESVRRWEEKILEIRDYVKKQDAETLAMKERFQRDIANQVNRKISSFLISFLEIQDNLDRSLQIQADQATTESLLQGMALISKQMQDVLKEHGVEKIVSISASFDPNLHEAIASLPVQTDEEDDKILEELRPGYLFEGNILRPARVVVGKKV